MTMHDGQTACPSCGTDLSNESGAVKKNGDGLYTYGYQEKFEENPFITEIQVDVETRLSFNVSCRRSEGNSFFPLLNVIYNETDNNYTYYLNGTSLTVATLPKIFKLEKKYWRKARYVQLEVYPRKINEIETYNTTFPTEIPVSQDYSFYVKEYSESRWQDMGLFDWSKLECTPINDLGSTNPLNKMILQNAYLDDEKKTMYFYFQDKIMRSNPLRNFTINHIKYTSTVNSFKVFGFHYKKSELTMTGTPQEKFFPFHNDKKYYQLSEYPTQILSIVLGQNASGGIVLNESEEKNTLSYELTKKSITIKNETKTIYVIKSGNYYFDHIHNRIYLPETGTCDDKTIKIAELEKELTGTGSEISFLPTKISIEYWSGSGEPITLQASAAGFGPSYQLEKDTITVIESPMPDNGTSCKLPDMKGNYAKRSIPWVCYNHIPSTLKYETQVSMGGMFKTPELASTTLGSTVDNDKFFVDQFGENCQGLGGKCETEVTFYGAPNQVLSGNITVKAPAYTTKTIDTGSGSVTMRERTGGIKNGCFIFKLMPSECKGRKTLAFSKPTIVVYAKERNPTDQF